MSVIGADRTARLGGPGPSREPARADARLDGCDAAPGSHPVEPGPRPGGDRSPRAAGPTRRRRHSPCAPGRRRRRQRWCRQRWCRPRRSRPPRTRARPAPPGSTAMEPPVGDRLADTDRRLGPAGRATAGTSRGDRSHRDQRGMSRAEGGPAAGARNRAAASASSPFRVEPGGGAERARPGSSSAHGHPRRRRRARRGAARRVGGRRPC